MKIFQKKCIFAIVAIAFGLTAPLRAQQLPVAEPLAPALLPNANTGTSTQPIAAELPVATSTAIVPGDAKIEAPDKSVDFKSLFFTPEEMHILLRAKTLYGRQGLGNEDLYDEEDLLDQLNGIKGKKNKVVVDVPTEKFYPQFYLNSMVYHAPNDWVVWLEENQVMYKFVPTSISTPSTRLKLIGTSKEQVTLEWRPINWDHVIEACKAHGSDVILDAARKIVTFSLRRNQTLFSYDMQIKEGKMLLMPVLAQPVVSTENMDNPLPEASASDNEIPPTTKVPEGDPKKGLSGLLNTYKNLDNPEQRQ